MVGSPTHGGFTTKQIHQLVKNIGAARDQRYAAFDTRTRKTVFGCTAPKMAWNLKRSGADLTAEPEGLFVSGVKGPLLGDELERAAVWAEQQRKLFSR